MPRFAEFVAIIAALMALTALSIDVMLPALPQMRDDFGLSDPNLQQLVITSYVAGFAFGQLFHGPLSDWLGRKPVLLVGLAVYAVASFACFSAGSFGVLLAARFVQGLANAAPRVVAIAVVRDVYGGRRMAEVMSFVMMVFIVVPVLAPTVGSLFLIFGTWHLIFAALLVISLAFLVWTAVRLPETRPAASREPMSLGWLVSAFALAATTRQTLGYTLATGVLFGSMMGYINSAEQVFVEVYGLGAWFPVVFGGVAAALALASFVNTRLVGRIGMRRILACRADRLRGHRAGASRHRHRLRAAAAAGLRGDAGAGALLLRVDHAELQRAGDGADGADRRHGLVLRRRGDHRGRGGARALGRAAV